jgi:hypothetical protein
VDRLTVCLYFMSCRNFPLGGIILTTLKRSCGRFSPPRKGNTPDSCRDFQATALRTLLNAEKAADPPHRLWENITKGHWRNTLLGNQRALMICAVRSSDSTPRQDQLTP